MSNTIESIVEHLTYIKGVVGVVVCTLDGVPIRDTFQQLDRTTALTYAELGASLARQAALLYIPPEGEKEVENKEEPEKKASKKEPTDYLEILRVRSRLNEIIIRQGGEFLIVIVQEPGEQ